jgi:hypothetical protein
MASLASGQCERPDRAGMTHSTVTTFSPLPQPILRTSLTHATRFTALLDPRNRPSRCTKKRAILTASASVILMTDVTPSSASAILRKNGGASPESIVDHGKRELNVLRDAVDPDALDDGIDLMPPSSTLALLSVVHDSVLNLRIVIRAVLGTNAAA